MENGDNFDETDSVSNLDRAHSYTLTKILLNKSIAKNISFLHLLSVLDNTMKYLQLVIWTAEKHITLRIAF